MEKALIFGHKNPDTDTICSAIAYADLKSKLGQEVEAVRLGEVNGETQFALDQFKVEAPRMIKTAANEVNKVILVDHNERQQSVSDIEDVTVVEVIDHHRIANFETSQPLYFRAEPVGCTATILNKMYKENGIEISAPEGTPAAAVHPGTVDYADAFGGFGNMVIVDHGGNYFSLYG